MEFQVKKLSIANRGDFFKIHAEDNNAGWCYCIAWWLPDWEGWDRRTAEENRMFRDQLLQSGLNDGYLFYVDHEPAGWCQCGPRDQFAKLCHNYKLTPDSTVWALTCFLISPKFRKRGLTHQFLRLILADLVLLNVRYVQSFPRCAAHLDDSDIWTGPEVAFIKAGFNRETSHSIFPVYGKRLAIEVV